MSIKHGLTCARKIMQRMSELHAVNCLSDMPPAGRPHPHKGDRSGLFSLDIQHPLRLIIKPAGKYDIRDFSTVTEVIVHEIFNPHN